MATVELLLIEEPAEGTATVIAPTALVPAFGGEGAHNYLCGGCGFVLAEGIDAGGIQSIVIRCPRCGDFNRTRT